MIRPAWLTLLAACVSPPDDLDAPRAPTVSDPDWTVTLGRHWNLIGNAATPGHDELAVTVEGDSNLPIDVWLNGTWRTSTRLDAAGTASVAIDLHDVPAGEHTLLLSTRDASVAFSQQRFTRSHPMYVVVSIDWDLADTPADELAWQESLHLDHPDLKLTQLVGAYTFTEPDITPERADELVDWLLDMQDTWGDEIGLHVHGYCSAVEAAGVPCRTQPSYVYDEGDESGYTVMSNAYSEAEFTDILFGAVALFEQWGLPRPTSYRAGAWITDTGILRALHTAGFLVDTSAVDTRFLRVWSDMADDGFGNGLIYDWNAENWSSIGPTSQPYYPGHEQAQYEGSPAIGVLQVPDNGALADYITGPEMIEVFEANWPGGALDAPTQLSIGFHNRTRGRNGDYRPRVETALRHFDAFLAAQDEGPVVYTTLTSLKDVWPQ